MRALWEMCVSFTTNATKEKTLQAAKVIVNLPVMTRGSWGDGSSPESLLTMAMNGCCPTLLLVPQANLISKVSCCVVLMMQKKF